MATASKPLSPTERARLARGVPKSYTPAMRRKLGKRGAHALARWRATQVPKLSAKRRKQLRDAQRRRRLALAA